MNNNLAAGFVGFFDKEVPPDFWNEDVEEDGTPVAILACVCGETPKVPLHGTAQCPGCERVFVNLGGRVKVGKLPPEDEAETEEINRES